MRKVIFFISSPLYERDIIRYGYNLLKKNKLEISFFNFTPILYPDFYRLAEKKSRYKGHNEKIFFNMNDALLEISKIEQDCFIVCMLHYNFLTHRIYRAISKSKLSYGLSSINIIPNNEKYNNNSFFQKLFNFKSSSFRSKILGRIFRYKYAKLLGINPPAVIIAGGGNSLSFEKLNLSDSATDILWTHTYDYDIYLNNINFNLSLNNIAVFIDAPSPMFEHDSLIPGISSPLTVEKYYPSLCNFFKILENNFGLRVVIASHPYSRHDSNPAYFGGREVFNNMTAELIKVSNLVINRNSTSINFAVLYNKPVIFHTSDEIELSPLGMKNQIKSMSLALGKAPINIDHLGDVSLSNEMTINTQAYNQYKNSFIKKNNTVDLPIWQIFSNWLKTKS